MDASCHSKGKEQRHVGLLRAYVTSIHAIQQPATKTPEVYHQLLQCPLPHAAASSGNQFEVLEVPTPNINRASNQK